MDQIALRPCPGALDHLGVINKYSEIFMHVIVLYDWKEETTELIRVISDAIGLTAYEVRQRLIGGSPTVVATFADPQQALALEKKLNQIGIATQVMDTEKEPSRAGYVTVRRFELHESSLLIETGNGQRAEIPYREIDILLPGTSSVKHSEKKTVTERKFSLGKTILAGGIPMSKKVKYQKDIATDKVTKVLYLYFSKRMQPIVFNRDGMTYEGLGAAMKTSRELNFAYLISELHRLCPTATYDDRLSKRIGQVRLLGPTLNPETHFDLAMEILARSLRSS